MDGFVVERGKCYLIFQLTITITVDISVDNNNGRDSFQLFVGVFDTCLVWYLLVLPSETHAVANMTSLRPTDGNTTGVSAVL